jgi:hypothetical protein
VEKKGNNNLSKAGSQKGVFSSLYKRYWCNSSTLHIPVERRGSETFAPLKSNLMRLIITRA